MATNKTITLTVYDLSGRAEIALFFDSKLNKIGSSKTEISIFESKEICPSPTTLFLKIEKNDIKPKNA